MLEPSPAWTDMGLKSYSYYSSYGARLTGALRGQPRCRVFQSPRGPFGRPCLLCDYIHFELGVSEDDQGRIVIRNEHFVALVPWWAVWPFELLGE